LSRRNRSKRRINKSLPPQITQPNVNGSVTAVTPWMAGLLPNGTQYTQGLANPMARDAFPYSFGPGVPFQPSPLDPVRRDSGRAEPRQWEYPVSWNIPGSNHRKVPWQVLRDASNIPIIRNFIRIRKNEASSLPWDIGIADSAIEAESRKTPDKAHEDIEKDLRNKLLPDMERVTEFWCEPDKRNGLKFSTWVSKAMEERLVLDALAIYPRYDYGGNLWSLEILDGTTIKPLLDHDGGRPLPPYPAYQQILWGFPRGEYVADLDSDGVIRLGDADSDTHTPGNYLSDQLIYEHKEHFTNTPYGLSPVEQSLVDADLWLKRMGWLRAEYTEGTMPTAWMRVVEGTQAAGYTITQIQELERNLNDYLSGNTGNRFRQRVLPPGFEPVQTTELAEKYKPDYDLYLLKLLCANFDMTIAEMGFTESKGLGDSGYHEGQSDVQDRKGLRPDLEWLASVITDISRKHLNMPKELEFKFLAKDSEDEKASDELAAAQLMRGAITLNDDRNRIGKPPYNFPEADMPMVITARGVVFLEGASETDVAGKLVQPGMAPPDINQEGQNAFPAGPPNRAGLDDKKKAELSAYHRWAAKGKRGRPFEFEHVDKTDAVLNEVDLNRAIFKAVDVDPKVLARTGHMWHGWLMDEAAARLWAGRLIESLTTKINVDHLASEWLRVRNSNKADFPGFTDAQAWLGEQAVGVHVLVGEVLNGVYIDGMVVGQQSAVAAAGSASTVDWGSWSPGDTQAAYEVLGVQGGAGLQRLLDDADVTINGVSGGRLDALANRLAEGLQEGWSSDQLARSLREVLGDISWAETVAQTEMTRAVSYSTLLTYQAQGVTKSIWLTAQDQRVCQFCRDNNGESRSIGQDFPSGDSQPPAHPRCRCALGPDIDSITLNSVSAVM
jgi:SPP1 gp7 family putative phage head morphogenesis protein